MKTKKELEYYIHIPFCLRKCRYCDFLSFPASDEDKKKYTGALYKEITMWEQAEEYQLVSVFLGGGTPSVLDAGEIRRIMDAVWQKNPDAARNKEEIEVTIECNPGTVTKEKLQIYKNCGISRISFGLQSASDEELQKLWRSHTWEEFLESCRLAREAGFDNINIDLMSALPGQNRDSWLDTLTKAAALEPEHISAYSLIIEEGTPFYDLYHEDCERRDAGKECFFLPSEEEERAMYDLTERYLKEMGYHRYEISNYAKPGRECRHNEGYWTGRDYKGFGLGAASLIGHVRFHNTADMTGYLLSPGTQEDREVLSVKDQMEETMFLGLRRMAGVSEEEFRRRFGTGMEEVYGEVLKDLTEKGLIIRKDGYISLTGKGIDISNYVLAQFLFG